MLGQLLTLDVFIPKRSLTTEWSTELLFHLWARGLRFQAQSDGEPTWEAELAANAYRSFWQNGKPTGDEITLQDFLQQVAQVSAGSTSCWDKELEMDLTLDPSGNEFKPEEISSMNLGLVHLWIDAGYLRPNVLLDPLPAPQAHGRLLTPAQQVLQAFTHWAEVLCDHLKPLFALGIEPEIDDRDQQSFNYERIYRSLIAGDVSENDGWPFLVYIPPQLINDALLRSIYTLNGRWVKRTRRGGLLVVHPSPGYAYETAEAYRQMALGQAIDRLFVNSNEEYERAARYFERARGIFAQIPSERDAWTARAAFERMHAHMHTQDGLAESVKRSNSAILLLSTDTPMDTLSRELVHDLGSEAEQMVKGRILYRFPHRSLSVVLKKDESSEKPSSSSEPDYRYQLEIRSTRSQVGYDSWQEWRAMLDSEARSIFEALKQRGTYRLALLNENGQISEQFQK